MSEPASEEELKELKPFLDEIDAVLGECLTVHPGIAAALDAIQARGFVLRVEDVKFNNYLSRISPKTGIKQLAAPTFEPLGTALDRNFLHEFRISLD